jgi:hypothetical protein
MAKGLSTSGAVGIVVEGLPELKAALDRLGTRGSRTAARKALTAGLKPVVKAIRSNTKTMVGKKTGTLQKSVGQRQVNDKKAGIYMAKAGLDVGKKKPKVDALAAFFGVKSEKKRTVAHHAHLIALGTKVRNYKGANRGKLEPTPIVPSAYSQSGSMSLSAMKTKLIIEINRETAKARRATK